MTLSARAMTSAWPVKSSTSRWALQCQLYTPDWLAALHDVSIVFAGKEDQLMLHLHVTVVFHHAWALPFV